MKVATLSLERTVHSHFLTPKTSSGTSIFMSCLTATWQARRSPSRAWRLLMWPVSVGRMAPPPSKTLTLHWAQVPPPPQDEPTNSWALASAPSCLPPAGISIVFSLLMLIFTLPVATSLERAARITYTRMMTIATKKKTPRMISVMCVYLVASELDAGEGHEAQRHQTGCDERDAETLQAGRDVGVLEIGRAS